jgi:glycosyltransferase involved in cell wall biosynthesis
MLEIARHLVDADSRVHVLLIGDGPLRPDVGARIASAALESNVHLLGTRRDMPRLWKALDAFVLPSLYEGLPLVLLEAQAAGVPGVVSDINPEEALIVPHLIQRKPLAAPPPAWAEEILAITRAPRTITPYDSLRIVQESDFNIDNSAHAMARLYAQALNLMPKSPDASMVAPQPS